jgi:hypothetical protein
MGKNFDFDAGFDPDKWNADNYREPDFKDIYDIEFEGEPETIEDNFEQTENGKYITEDGEEINVEDFDTDTEFEIDLDDEDTTEVNDYET